MSDFLEGMAWGALAMFLAGLVILADAARHRPEPTPIKADKLPVCWPHKCAQA